MKRTGSLTRLASGLVAVVAFLLLLVVLFRTVRSSDRASDPGTEEVTATPTATEAVTPEDLLVLEREHQIQLQLDVDPALSQVSEEDARQAAEGAAPSFSGGSHPSATVLVRFTDAGYGPDTDGDGNPSPFFVDRVAWVVNYRDIETRGFGGPAYPEGETPPEVPDNTFVADFFVFVDALSGEVLESVTI